VKVEPGARVHVERASAHEAVVVVESGELHASITSGLKNVWRFKAGPHEVVVRGTKLSVKWQPALQALAVEVTEGKVEVHLGDGRIEWVRAGERLVDEPAQHAAAGQLAPAAAPAAEEVEEVAIEPTPTLTPTPTTPAAVAAAKPQPKVAPKPAPVAAKTHEDEVQVEEAVVPAAGGAAKHTPVSDWKKQAEAGHYGKAVTLVEEQGVDGAMQSASADDMLLFADAARLVRRVDLGRAVLVALREKFAGSAEATEAAFRLGRLEFDAENYAPAGRWFDLYAKEAPLGAFEQEALGRRLDAWRRAGDARAFDAAREYLEKYPKGAYASLAHQVLGRE
jgi:hypothetical protein